MINKISINTKMGWVSVFAEDNRITQIKFGKTKKQKKNKLLKKFKENILTFFKEKKFKYNTPYELNGTLMQKKIWNELKEIKVGTTKTYGEIGKKYKISPRYVGKICSQNKLVLLIPCHRVIRSDGSLGGFTSNGGIKLKKKLLQFEKI